MSSSNRLHRCINSVLSITVLTVCLLLINPVVKSTNDLYLKYSGIAHLSIMNNEIAQIASDEGYRRCAYKDSLGLKTVGFGTIIKDDTTTVCIDPLRAVELLREHYTIATESVDKNYPWATEAERLVLVNLSYNMGASRLSRFKLMLRHMQEGSCDLSAAELLNSKYARQVPSRAGRMAGRIMGLPIRDE